MQCIAVDLGNVMLSVDLKKFTNELDKYVVEADKAFHNSLFFLEHLQTHQEIGLTTVARALKIEYDFNNGIIASLLEAWNEVIKPNEMMLVMLNNLKKLGIKIAILSNIGEEHTNYIKETYPQIFQNNELWLSYEVGARKPSKLFFQSFLQDNPEWKGAPFIDDRKENLKIASLYGFNTVHFNLDKVMEYKDPQRVIDHFRRKIERAII